LKTRGTGGVYRPRYKNKKTGKVKESSIWWIYYYHNGKEYRESSKSRKKNIASTLLRKKIEELKPGQIHDKEASKITFEDLKELLIRDYRINKRKSQWRAEISVSRLAEFFGDDRAIEITSQRVEQYKEYRLDSGVAASTINNELAALSRMFSLALRLEVLGQRPHVQKLEVQNARHGFFEREDFQSVYSHLPEDLKPVMEFAYLTGWRKSEILNLEWKQINFFKGTARLEPGTTKNDEGREFPFRALTQLETLLINQRKKTDGLEKKVGQTIPWVFHRRGDQVKNYDKAWRKACRAVGLEGRIVHDFRRTAVRNLEQAGVPRSVAMKLTGHKTEAVYRRYAIVSENDLSQAVGKLSELHENETIKVLSKSEGSEADVEDPKFLRDKSGGEQAPGGPPGLQIQRAVRTTR